MLGSYQALINKLYDLCSAKTLLCHKLTLL